MPCIRLRGCIDGSGHPISPQGILAHRSRGRKPGGIFSNYFSRGFSFLVESSFDSITTAARAAGMNITRAATAAPANANGIIFMTCYYEGLAEDISPVVGKSQTFKTARAVWWKNSITRWSVVLPEALF
jgi:hypothetical protein